MSTISKAQIYSIFFIPLAFFLVSCRSNRLDVNVDNIQVDIQINRFDKDLFSIAPSTVFTQVPELEKKYPNFYQLYFENILRFGQTADTAYLAITKDFLTNEDIKTLQHDIDSIYPDTDEIKAELTDAFKHFKYHFPTETIPEVIAFNSTFNNAIVTTDSLLAIGLDMFLGKDYRYYPSVGFPQFMVRRLSKEYITSTAMKGFAKYLYDQSEEDRTLISQMIYEGKMLYFLDAMLPETPDTLKIGYTAKQLDWCRENESDTWRLFLEGDLLYSTDFKKNAPYLNDGPFTSTISNDSPPMLGVWIGWQIVRKYMNGHPEVTLPQLMKKNADEVLKGSKYKPK